MKYINQLNDDELLEILKPFIWGEFKEFDYIRRQDEGIKVNAISECDDDENEDGKIILEDRFILHDYDVEIWDYQANNKSELIREYRAKLLNRFGNQYALDYLLE